jgi:hypothetical protein
MGTKFNMRMEICNE